MAEVRKKDGTAYTPRSIHLILAVIQRTVLEVSPDSPRFFDESDNTFRELRLLCESVYRELRSQGIGTKVYDM